MLKVHKSWQRILEPETKEPYFKALAKFVEEEHQKHKVYPVTNNIFKAFDLCHFDQVKVVILGQDPYHGEGQAKRADRCKNR